jgi:hypothetical protein
MRPLKKSRVLSDSNKSESTLTVSGVGWPAISTGRSSAMTNLPGVSGLFLAAGISLATAAGPQIPSSDLPGRERDRFTESPVEKFMRPGVPQPPQVLAPWRGSQCVNPSRRSKSRSSNRKNC